MSRIGLTRRALALAAAGAVAASAAAARSRKPPVPPGRDPGPSAIPFAIIDSGVDYRDPQIAARLARDGEGGLIGWDAEDSDPLPFDRPFPENDGPALGTPLARHVLAETQASKLVPVRRRSGDPLSLARSLSFTAQTPARVALIIRTGRDEREWSAFGEACAHYRAMLIIAAAGDGGQDLDRERSFPAALRLDNLIVVTACEDGGGLSEQASHGAASVDVAVTWRDHATGGSPAIERTATAAARVTALAVRLRAVSPGLDGAAMKARILALAKPIPAVPRTRAGWIPRASRAFWLE